ncbi:MAG: type II toxin-antitoxin system VapC family toxin [Elusimicrobia bacterium]|nr:type II toxin-antitoxin system VapC family toxin [Elusimicrobiota bacterium]
MKALLDTCAFLWMVTDAAELSPRAREVMADPGNGLYLSAASCWEIAIKCGLGKIRISGAPEKVVPDLMQRLSIQPLPVLPSHALHTGALKPLHRDPFDRLLVSQAELEGLPLLTPDPLIRAYGVETVW